MNEKQKTALAMFIVAIFALFLIPPFFGIDRTSRGRIHASIGFHPAWAPPDEEYAYEVLVEKGFLPSEGLDVTNLDVHRNNVLMVLSSRPSGHSRRSRRLEEAGDMPLAKAGNPGAVI